MEIKIYGDSEYDPITLSSKYNDNFIKVEIGKESLSVSIDELLSAVHSFEQKRIIKIARENNYRE